MKNVEFSRWIFGYRFEEEEDLPHHEIETVQQYNYKTALEWCNKRNAERLDNKVWWVIKRIEE